MLLIPMQIAVTVVALAMLAVWPPASGAMLIVPLVHSDANATARVALSGGAMLLGAGPLPGSMTIVGERSKVARRIAAWDFILLAAPPAGCNAGGALASPA